MSAFLPDETRIRQIKLRTRDLDRVLRFYTGTLGMRLVEEPGGSREVGISSTGTAPAIVVLHEERDAKPRPPGGIGLYHMAFRYPTRLALAQALQRLLRDGYPMQGASDHKVSEAIYLSDPEANGVELYVDRPRSQWTWRNGQVEMTTEPLDMDKLLTVADEKPVPPHVPSETDLGHIHLHVADLAVAERFYHDFLGLAVTQRSYPGALFFATGGYHHHVAVNTWTGRQPSSANTTGLISYRLEVPEAEILYCLRNRAPLAGYEATTTIGETGSDLLQIRDPNGHWLQVQPVSVPTSNPVEGKCAQTRDQEMNYESEH